MDRPPRFLQQQLDTLNAYPPEWELVAGESKGLYRHEVTAAGTWRYARGPLGSPNKIVGPVLDRRDRLLNFALEAADGQYTGRFDQVTAMWPLMLPHHPDALAAHGHPGSSGPSPRTATAPNRFSTPSAPRVAL